jgi:hypothetical protein
MEIVVADRDGTFHAVSETIEQLGSTLDAIYLNSNYRDNSYYDILGGPDQFYIWSECQYLRQKTA